MHFHHLVCLLLLSVLLSVFFSLICSVLHCLSIVICAEPRADDDEADIVSADWMAGKLYMLKQLLDDSTNPDRSCNHHK